MQILSRHLPIHIKHAEDGERLKPGTTYITLLNYYQRFTCACQKTCILSGRRPSFYLSP